MRRAEPEQSKAYFAPSRLLTITWPWEEEQQQQQQQHIGRGTSTSGAAGSQTRPARGGLLQLHSHSQFHANKHPWGDIVAFGLPAIRSFFFVHTSSLVMTPPPTPAAIAHAALCDARLAHDSLPLLCYKSMSCSMYPPVFFAPPQPTKPLWTTTTALLLSPPVAQVEPVTRRRPLVARRHLSCSTPGRAQKGLISDLG